MQTHDCTQSEKIKTLSESIRNIETMMSEMRKDIKEMKPEYHAVADIRTFLRIGKSFGTWASFVIVTCSIVFGAIYAIRDWMQK